MSSLLQNFGYAIDGIKYFFRSERNGRIQLLIAVTVIVLGFIIELSAMEWCIILGCIALVISLEMMNTALERVCAMLSLEFHPMVKIIKDVAAGAVLWAVVFCSIIGLIIFIPHIIALAGK